MSDDEEKKILRPNLDGGSSNSETLTEGNVLSLESNENIENSSSKIENMPRSGALEGSGDSAGRNILESNKNTEKSSTVTEHMPQTAAIDCSGDSASHIAQEKKILDKLEAGLNIKEQDFTGLDEVIGGISTEVPTLETNVVAEGGSNDNVPVEESEDDDMQLRWDEDDDASNLLEGDNNANVANTNDEINSACDVCTEKGNNESVTFKDTAKESETNPELEVHTDKTDLETITLKESETDPELDVQSDMTDYESVTLKDTAEESETSPKLDVHSDMAEHESVTLKDTAKESETNPELDVHTDMTDHESVTLKDTAKVSQTSPELDIHPDKTDLESVTLKDTAKESESSPELDVQSDMTDHESVTLIDTAKASETSPKLDVQSDMTDHESVTLIDTAKASETSPKLDVQSDMTDHESVTLKDTAKASETSLELDVQSDMTNHESVTLKDTAEESETSPILDVQSDMAEYESVTLKDTTEESETGPELDAHTDKTDLESVTLKDTAKKPDSDPEREMHFMTSSMVDELLEELDVTERVMTAEEKMSEAKEIIDIESKTETYKLFLETLTRDGSSEIITVKDVESSDNIPEKDFPIPEEVDDDILLEEKLLAEPEISEVIPESDVAFDDENESELLKDDDDQNENCTPMDVDSTDPSIEDQVNIEVKIIDQPINDESEVRKKDVAQTDLEKVGIDQTTDEIKVMDELDAQLQITEKIIDQPVEDTSKTVEVIKDIPIQEKSETVEFNKETATEDQAKIDEKHINIAVSETENVNQPMNDEKKMDENSKVQLIEENNITEDSIKTPEQSDALTVSDIPSIEIEAQEKSILDHSTLEKEMGSKKEQKQSKLNTESVCKDINIEIPEKSKENDKLDSSVSPSSSSIFRDSLSPIKGFHGLNKPDVMLEIPTQELIDIDMTDLSMDLDQSDVIDSNDKDENIEKELDVKTIDTSNAEDATEVNKSVDNITKVVDDSAKQCTVDQDTVGTETNADKIITVIEEPEDQQTIATEATAEVPIENKVEKNDDKNEKPVGESTVEDNMERMFAGDESEAAKVPECIASTSKTVEQSSTSSTQMTPDMSDEVPEVSDSLGLLAESTGRSMEDDEDDDDGDDDDGDDYDESSNQVSAEQSEDSNPAALETGPVTEIEDKELETPEPKESQFPFLKDCYSLDKGHLGYGTIELQAETITEINEEAESAVQALLDADNPVIEPAKAPKETAEPMDIETVKLSDTSDNEADVDPPAVKSVAEPSKEVEEKQKKSPSKSPSKSPLQVKGSPKPFQLKHLDKTKQPGRTVVSIVDLEGSSSSDEDVQETEVKKQLSLEPQTKDDSSPSPDPESQVTSVNIPTGIDIMCTSGGTTSEITTKDDGEAVISGLPKPPPHKRARLNTSEVTIKTVSATEPMVIPETTMTEQNQASTRPKPKLSLEIFNLDSDEEDNSGKELEKPRGTSKCINYSCPSDDTVPCRPADAAEVAYYVATKRKRPLVCQPCAAVVADRTKNLIQGVKDLTPLLDLDMRKSPQELVEISDSDSEDDDTNEEPKQTIGKEGAKIVESSLSKFLNDTWMKYNMDARLKEAQIMLDDEMEKLEQDSKDLDEMLQECQVATDKLRNDLYATFEFRKEELPPLIIHDTPEKKYVGPEEKIIPGPGAETITIRQVKRSLSSNSMDLPAKRPAIPLGYAPLGSPDSKQMMEIAASPQATTDAKIDEDKDISVVKLSAEAAPAELPPPGEISRPPLRVGMPVLAMKNAFGPFLKGKVLEIQPKNPSGGNPFSLCRVRFDHKPKSSGKVLPARSIAYAEPADVRMTIGTRLIALFKDLDKRESFYSGVVAEIPNPVNNYRYLVFFDDGYAQYISHQHTRLVCESSHFVWEEVHPFSRNFVREYLLAYPERPMVRLHTGQHLKTEWNGKWWPAKVVQVDASLSQVMFVHDGRREWIYRGSTRLAPLYLELQAAERHRVRPMPRSKAQPRSNMPYVEYIRSDEQESQLEAQAQAQQQMRQQQLQRDEEIRRQRAVAKKSTSAPTQTPVVAPSTVEQSRVVYYTPKNAVKPLKMVPHKCGTNCKRSDILSLKELRTYNPLAKPLLSGWERQIVRYKGHKDVMYRAPCGRRIRNMYELHSYLRATESVLPVDLFDFHYLTHCLSEYVFSKCLVMKKDLSHGKENVPVPCVNYLDDSLPEFCSYNTERTPTAGVPLNLEPEFLCGCDCTDDCQDKSKCACWKMTLEGARTIGLVGPNVGYAYKRLPEPLPSGIYECNSRCKCKHTCLNRVAQHPLQLKLQVFKTPNRGWGIRALNDVPKGSFLCVYAGNLLTDATANLDGLNEGDEYLAELDYIEVVEQMKEGYEEDIPDADKKLDKKEKGKEDEESSESSSSSEDEEPASKTDKEDDDFRPAFFAGVAPGVAEFNKRLRKREKSKKDKENAAAEDKDKEKDKDPKEPKEGNADEDCITISDDDEVRVPSSFMAQTNMGANEYISKYKSVRTLFGNDEACYIMDAKVQGNIGRYLNHSCCPNVFVQNVFVDTHDPRFPWVAFFALCYIKAGTELTWNYNYDVGSVPGKVLYCYCGAVNCRGRLL